MMMSLPWQLRAARRAQRDSSVDCSVVSSMRERKRLHLAGFRVADIDAKRVFATFAHIALKHRAHRVVAQFVPRNLRQRDDANRAVHPRRAAVDHAAAIVDLYT